jgi:hypothetical protein
MTQQERLKKIFEENAEIDYQSDIEQQMSVDTFIRVASELLEERWIPISERLPEAGKRVSVTDGKLVCEGNINRRNGLWEGWRNVNDEYLEEITHWKNLPQPPNN